MKLITYLQIQCQERKGRMSVTSTPSSPVYPQRVTLQPGTPNTVARMEVMKVSLLRSSFSPSCSTRDMDGPDNTQLINYLHNLKYGEWRAHTEELKEESRWNKLKQNATKCNKNSVIKKSGEGGREEMEIEGMRRKAEGKE